MQYKLAANINTLVRTDEGGDLMHEVGGGERQYPDPLWTNQNRFQIHYSSQLLLLPPIKSPRLFIPNKINN